jgi:hypothetical protein
MQLSFIQRNQVSASFILDDKYAVTPGYTRDIMSPHIGILGVLLYLTSRTLASCTRIRSIQRMSRVSLLACISGHACSDTLGMGGAQSASGCCRDLHRERSISPADFIDVVVVSRRQRVAPALIST